MRPQGQGHRGHWPQQMRGCQGPQLLAGRSTRQLVSYRPLIFFLGYGENNFLILQSGRLNCNVFFFYLLHHMFHLCILCLFDYILSISHFVEDWVRIGQPAKKKVQTECKALSFDDQCSVLEKVRRIPSVFSPLMNY
jgi:hypothetical protein